MNRHHLLAVFSIVGLAVISGCNSTPGTNDNANANANDNSTDVVVPDTTKMLSTDDVDALESPDGNLATLVFDTETPALASLADNDVLATGVHGDKLPYGMLRKVTAIDRTGGKVTVHTEQATLTDAIERGSLQETFTLSPDNIVAHRIAPGHEASLRPIAVQQTGQGFVFAINDYELYDADGNPATREDRVWLEGNVSFLPTIDFDIDIDGFVLKTLVFKVGSEQQASVRVTAGRAATFDKTEVIETIELAPITFAIGPVPVVLVPRIQLRVGINGTVTADLTAGAQADATVSVGFGYQNGQFAPVSEVKPTASFDTPHFREGAKGTAKVWAGPRAELAAYGVAGVYGELRGFIEGDVDTTANPWWTLSAGVEAVAGVFIRLFDVTLADYETDPIGTTIKLADAGGPAPSEQSDVITWSRTIGGPAGDDNSDNPLAIITTADGGSLLVGGSNSFTSSPSDTWIIKLDQLGQVSWQEAFDDLRVGIGAAPHPDGGYVVLTGVVGTGIDHINLLHIDDNGEVIWSRQYESDRPIGGYGLLPSGDDFIIGGTYDGGTDAQFWLAKFDSDGQVIWSKALGGDRGDEINGFDVAADGSIVAVGPTNSFGVSFNGHWVVKFNTDGAVQWQNAYDGDGNEWAYSVVADADGNCKILGRTSDDALVTKVDANGNLLIARTFDAGSPYEEAFAAIGTADGGLLIAGNTGLGSDADLWLLRLTPQLEVLWTTSYGGPAGDEAGGYIQYGATSRPLAMTADEGFLVLANTQSFGASFYDMWVQKVSGTGVVTYDSGSDATRKALAGSYQDYDITVTPTNESVQDVNLIVTPADVQLYTPSPRITTLATP